MIILPYSVGAFSLPSKTTPHLRVIESLSIYVSLKKKRRKIIIIGRVEIIMRHCRRSSINVSGMTPWDYTSVVSTPCARLIEKRLRCVCWLIAACQAPCKLSQMEIRGLLCACVCSRDCPYKTFVCTRYDRMQEGVRFLCSCCRGTGNARGLISLDHIALDRYRWYALA